MENLPQILKEQYNIKITAVLWIYTGIDLASSSLQIAKETNYR